MNDLSISLLSTLNCAGVRLVKGAYMIVSADDSERPATAEELQAATVALRNDDVKRIESDTARSEAKQACSELQPLIEHKDPAIALLAAIMQKHLLATLGR